jgi:Rad51
MPSLRSIGIHPQLQEKLAALDPSIETPQALLSRDPASLALALNAPLHIINKVRSAVADALIVSTRDGKRSLRVAATLNHDETNLKNLALLGSVSALDYTLYQQQVCIASAISSGSQRLDKLLGIDDENPGLSFGNITELTGPPSSGKTQVAIALAAQHAGEGGKVFFMASGFGHGTIVPLARRLSQYTNKENYQRILNNVQFTPIVNGYIALAFLLQLEEDYIHDDDSNSKGYLLVLDSVSGVLSGDLYSSGEQDLGTVIAYQLALQLKGMVRNYNMAVLVVNGTVSGQNGSKPALGQIWRAADIQLWLEIVNTSNKKSLSKIIGVRLKKHPFRAWHREETIQLAEFGFTMNQGRIADINTEQHSEAD